MKLRAGRQTEIKFRQILVFTAKVLKIKVFRQKSGKSVSKMQFLQRIIALFFRFEQSQWDKQRS